MNLLNMQVSKRLIMEQQTIYDLNRAVHLARSEVFFEMSVERIRECMQEHAEAQRKTHAKSPFIPSVSSRDTPPMAAKASAPTAGKSLCRLAANGALLPAFRPRLA